MADGQALSKKDRTCPFCKRDWKKAEIRIVDKDKDVALLEDPKGHRWTVLLKKG